MVPSQFSRALGFKIRSGVDITQCYNSFQVQCMLNECGQPKERLQMTSLKRFNFRGTYPTWQKINQVSDFQSSLKEIPSRLLFISMGFPCSRAYSTFISYTLKTYYLRCSVHTLPRLVAAMLLAWCAHVCDRQHEKGCLVLQRDSTRDSSITDSVLTDSIRQLEII